MTGWTVETLGKEVDSELEMLPQDMLGRFFWIGELIQTKGLPNLGMPYIRNLDKKLWEIRVSGRDGIARGIYVVATGKRVVVVHVFIKKTEKTPPAAIRLARQRAEKAGLL